jgi:adenylylsulfate kinase
MSEPGGELLGAESAAPHRRGGATVWLTGLPGAGKSTIAAGLAERLLAADAGARVEVLDGDQMRAALSPTLGYSREDREENVRRVGFVAELLASHDVLVLVPVIAPYAASRAAVREHHRRRGTRYLEIHVATPVEICARRDVKGLYAAQAAGRLRGLTGVDDPYEAPAAPDLRLDTDGRTVAESVDQAWRSLLDRGLIQAGRVRART